MTQFKIILILFVVTGFISCRQANNQDRNPSSEGDPPKVPPDTVELPEPAVRTQGTQDGTRFKLTELSAINDKFIKIQEDMVFSGIEETIKEPLKEISLNIKSHCIFRTAKEPEKVIIKEYTRELTAVIPIIEIVPAEVLLHKGNGYPTCGFSFKAINKAGSAHHFEWPQLPIVDYKEGRDFSLLTKEEPQTDTLVHLFTDRLSEYTLNTGPKNHIQQLDFVCDDFSLSLLVRPLQFIPLIAFPFHSQLVETIDNIKQKNPFQNCRIFGYNNNTLLGVSAFFKLVYPSHRPFKIKKRNNSDFMVSGDAFHSQIVHSTGELKKNIDGIPLYSIEIINPFLYPVHIFIKEQENRTMQSYSFYQTAKQLAPKDPVWEKQSMYNDDTVPFSLDKLAIKNGEAVIKETTEGTLITIEPNAWVSLSVVLNQAPDICNVKKRFSKERSVDWIGSLFEYPELGIFQLVSDKLPFTAKQNIVQKLNTTNFKEEDEPRHLSILSSKNLENNSQMQEIRHLLFRAGRCFKNPSQFDYTKPILSVYRDMNGDHNLGYWLTEWKDMYFSEEDYEKMNEKIKSALGRRIARGI